MLTLSLCDTFLELLLVFFFFFNLTFAVDSKADLVQTAKFVILLKKEKKNSDFITLDSFKICGKI